MNRFYFKCLLLTVLVTLVALTGCGGGGGGGVGANPPAVPLIIPTANQIALPSSYSSDAYPTISSNVELELKNFAATSEALMVFVNMSDSAQQLSYNVDKLSLAASRRDSAVLRKSQSEDTKEISPEQAFHLRLRQQAQRQPKPGQSSSPLRASTRAVALNGEEGFTLYVSNTDTQKTTAVCRHTELLAGTDKFFHIFVDKNSNGAANIGYIVSKIADNWKSIYVKNREIFGEEPTGTLENGVNATDFYIVLSPKVFTAGYFFTGDLNLASQSPTANEKKIFFLQFDSNEEKDLAVNVLSATMAHEFQHMIHFLQRGNSSDVWLEEALSGYAEHINGFRIDNKINQSKALQANYYFSRVSELKLDAWHSTSDSDAVVNSHYGKVFLFGVWLAQNYGNNGSVVSLLKNQANDVAAIEAFTGKNFGEIYSKFMLALIVNNPDTANDGYGIKGLNLTGSYNFDYGMSTVTLSGPAVDSLYATSASLSKPVIASRAAAYVRVTKGDGSGLWLAATLPPGTALYQLRKD